MPVGDPSDSLARPSTRSYTHRMLTSVWTVVACLAYQEVLVQEAFIDFETLPDSTPACRSCALSGQFSSLGVRFRFRSPFVGDIPARLIDSSAYDPPGPPPNHSATAALTDRGFEVGVLVVRFERRVTRARFRIRGSTLIDGFLVRAYGADGELGEGAVRRTVATTFKRYTEATFGEEWWIVEDPDGILRIELDGTGPPGHILLLDELSFSGDP